MLLRILARSLARRRSRKLLAVLTIWVGMTLVVALITLSLDVRDKINRELSAFGANIRVEPSAGAVPVRVGGYELAPRIGQIYLNEGQMEKLETLFWRNNILGVFLRLWVQVRVDGRDVPLLGIGAPHGSAAAGSVSFTPDSLKGYGHWHVKGAWPQADDECLVGVDAARELGLTPGEWVRLTLAGRTRSLRVRGIVVTGEREDGALIASLSTVQDFAGLPQKISEADVSTLTTPENKLAEKYRLDPTSLTPAEYERWSCTPYPGSVAAAIQEAIGGSAARVVRRVSETQGAVLIRMEGLMTILGGLTAVVCCLSVIGVLTSAVLERRSEVALLQAIGAHRRDVLLLFSCESAALGLLGGALAAVSGPVLGQGLVNAVFGGEAGSLGVLAILSPLLGLIVAWVACLWPVSQVLHQSTAQVLHGN
ncbi:MAG: ABC transporter permease [Deltaproteobacteria bacterium]|nr:ABC transporter permease [Deltaproteobacteria bacterium]